MQYSQCQFKRNFNSQASDSTHLWILIKCSYVESNSYPDKCRFLPQSGQNYSRPEIRFPRRVSKPDQTWPRPQSRPPSRGWPARTTAHRIGRIRAVSRIGMAQELGRFRRSWAWTLPVWAGLGGPPKVPGTFRTNSIGDILGRGRKS